MPHTATCKAGGGASAPPILPDIVFRTNKNDVLEANIKHALGELSAGRLSPFKPEELSGGHPLHIVAGGPSAKHTINELGRHVVAVNGAHDWLLSMDMVPTYAAFLCWSGLLVDGVTPHPNVSYYAASQCDPALLGKLPGVKVWHTPFAGQFVGNPDQMVYGGGPTVSQRIIPLFHHLGYRDFHFHGVDACFQGDADHAYPWKEEGLSRLEQFDVVCGGRTFRTRADWAGQAQWFFKILDVFRKTLEPFTVTVHGDGLIPHMARMKGLHAHSIKDAA